MRRAWWGLLGIVGVACTSFGSAGGGASDAAVDVAPDVAPLPSEASPSGDAGTSADSPGPGVLPDAGGSDAASVDSSVDPPVARDAGRGCLLADGGVPPAFKACVDAVDCVAASHFLDCCGNVIRVGVAAAELTAYGRCEATWQATFGACPPSCSLGPPFAEDGRSLGFTGVASVECSVGFCRTFLKE